VQTSARRRGYIGVSDSKHCSLACIRGSSVARRRRTAWGSGESHHKPPPETNPKRCRGNAVNRLMQDPGAGGWRPGGSDWPFHQSGVACIPKYAVLSRGCDEREEAHTNAQDTVRLKVTAREASAMRIAGAEIAAKPVAEKAPGQPGSADCSRSKCRCKNWYGVPGAGVEAARGH